MVDTVKIRQLRPLPKTAKRAEAESQEPAPLGGLDRVVEEVKLALLTTGLSLESEKGRGQNPYDSRPVAKTRDAWSDRNRRR
jgi:hypothetical protein